MAQCAMPLQRPRSNWPRRRRVARSKRPHAWWRARQGQWCWRGQNRGTRASRGWERAIGDISAIGSAGMAGASLGQGNQSCQKWLRGAPGRARNRERMRGGEGEAGYGPRGEGVEEMLGEGARLLNRRRMDPMHMHRRAERLNGACYSSGGGAPRASQRIRPRIGRQRESHAS